MPVSQHYGGLLEGGGSGDFSARCKAALEKCGFDPKSFGSYGDVSKQIQDAKLKCAQWDLAKAKGQATSGSPPTAQDYHLAGCQAGHIRQSATAQRSLKKGESDTHCRTVVDGYNREAAACLPQSGSAKGSGTHGIASWKEWTQTGKYGPRGELNYKVADRHRDERDRIRATINRQQEQMNASEKKAEVARAEAKGVPPGDLTKTKVYKASSAEKDLAADCISAHSKFNEKTMQAAAKKAAKDSPDGATPKGYQGELASRQQAVAAADQNAKAKWKAVGDAEKARKANPGPETDAAKKLALTEARGAQNEKRQAQTSLDQCSPASQKCLIDQGNRLNKGQGRTMSRTPLTSFTKTRPPSETGPKTTQTV